jgi:hypothetical protein
MSHLLVRTRRGIATNAVASSMKTWSGSKERVIGNTGLVATVYPLTPWNCPDSVESIAPAITPRSAKSSAM